MPPLEIVQPHDPRRCQFVASNGQCVYIKKEKSNFCEIHAAGSTAKEKKFQLARYRLQQYQERVAEFSNDDEIKSLREEIGIMRMALEQVIVQCQSANDLLIRSDKISNMVGQIQRLVESAQKLEERNNNLLDRKIVIIIADSIVTLIGNYITDPDKLTEIGSKICESIENAASPTYTIGSKP